jgi:hypothetical protein
MFASLIKTINGGGHIKITTSKNSLFSEAVVLICLPGGHFIQPVSKITSQILSSGKVHLSPILSMHIYIQDA